jgi:DNA-binding CsgD family transcriptional regulator
VRLVERESELADLTRMLTECSQQGRGKVALISGAVASGKTALLLTFAEQARRSGALFLGATSSRSEKSLQLGVIDQLFRNADLQLRLAEQAEKLLETARSSAFVESADSVAQGSGLPLDRAWLSLLWKLLRELSSTRPVVISVDNTQFIDNYSLQCLRYLLHRFRYTAIFTVLTRDLSQRSTNSTLDTELLGDPDCRHIKLDLLSQRGVKALLANRLGPARAEALGTACYAATGGNPLLVNALISDYQAQAQPAGSLSAGDSFAGAVANCLYRSGRLVSDAARAIAVSGEAFSPLLDELIGHASSSGHHPLHALRAMGLMEGTNFRHEAVRTAVLRETTPKVRAAIHHEIANLLHEHGAQPEVLAPHIVAADRHDKPWMPRVLREAADRAMSGQDVNTAIRYLRLAHRSFPDDRQRTATTSLLACAEWQVAPGAAVRYLPELSAAAQNADLIGGDSGRLIRYLLWFGKIDEAANLVVRSAEARSSGTASLKLPESLRSWLLLFCPDAFTRFHDGRLPQPVRDPGELVAAAQKTLESSVLDDSSLAQIIEALNVLCGLGRYEIAASCCESLLKEARVRSTWTWYAMLSAFHSLIALQSGNIPAAKERALHAYAVIPPKGWGVLIGIPVSTLVLASIMQGDYAQASRYLSISINPAVFQTTFALPYLYARGKYHLTTHDFQAALDDFQKCRELTSKWNLDLTCLIPWRTGAAEAYLRMNKSEQARELAEEELSLSGPGHQRAQGIALRIRASLSETRIRSAILREAIELLDVAGDRAELALAFADLAQVYYGLGNRHQARTMDRRANRLADQCGVVLAPVITRGSVEVLPDKHGEEASQDPAMELSNAELRVASLAARGYSNREIADNLYITVSTVEQHLTRIYRKLHVHRRSDLPVGLTSYRKSG